MEGRPTTFWAKLRRDASGDEVVAWHPLPDHCCDVAAVTEALLRLPLWSARIARLAGLPKLDGVTQARLCVLAALHDFGKLTIPFQAKGRKDLGGPTGGHVGVAIATVDHSKDVQQILAPLVDFGDGAGGLLVSALAHHGRPVGDEGHQTSRWAPRGGLVPLDGLRELLASARHWFPGAFEEGPPLPERPALEHAFAGLVMLADWLGSDEKLFPYSLGTEDRIVFARERAAEILRAMGLEVPLPHRLDPAGRGAFARVSEHPPRAAQRAVASLSLSPEGSITVLESETGSGKTEAALAHFTRLFEAGAVDGLYFALPTRTAATQLFDRVQRAARRAFPDRSPPVVLAVPGYLQVDDAVGQRLAPFEVLWPDQDRLRYRAWAAEGPKRYLAGAIVVGTIDQVLLSSLRVSHAHLRATSLLRHLLVVDEVHASDTYMGRILQEVLARHARAGGHALLLSATLGGEARGCLVRPDGPAPKVAFEEARAAPYPLVSHRALSSSKPEQIPVAHDGRSREVEVVSVPLMEDACGIARRALEAAQAGAKVLVLRNTVVDCVATQRALEGLAAGSEHVLFTCRGAIAPHHARYSRADRKALDEAVEERFGKDRSEGGCVVVATQTIQQSLDLDGDLLLTDLCPVDVLLQRIGRLHRHERTRPAGFERPRAVVLVPADRDLGRLIRSDGGASNHHGLGRVYPDLRIIEATWRAIGAHSVWRIPEMSRELVEGCLHSSALSEIVRTSAAAFAEHEKRLLGQTYGEKRMAELNLIDWAQPYSTMTFGDLEERIKTRLGEEDRRVVFSSPLPGPFGEPVTELVLRAFWARGVSADVEPEVESCREGVVTFRLGEKRFVYDRLGVRPAEDPTNSTKEKTDDDGP